MCEAMGIKKTTLFDTRLQMLNKESNERILYRNMALFISSFWFHLANCVFFLINFIARHVFRIKEDSSEKAMKDYSVVPLEPMPEANEIEERGFNGFGGGEEEEEEEEEEEPSNFSFKFEYQISKESTVSNDESSVPAREENYQAKTTNISNYRFFSERNFSGFVEEPEAATFQVHESFIDGGDSEDESKFVSAGNFQNPSIQSQDEKLVQKIPVVAESFSGLDSGSAGDFEKPSMQFQNEKLEERIPIVSETNSVGEKEGSFSGLDSDSAEDFEKSNRQFQDVMFFELQKLEGKRPIGFETNSVGEKEITESFSGFDSDSDSISLSDGYSVKNLIIDSDSDGFLSEKDFEDKESLIDSSTFDMELMEDREKIEEGQSSNSSAVFSKVNNQIDSGIIYDDAFLSESGFKESEKISEEKIHENFSPYTDKLSQLDEIWSENDSVEPEVELKELNVVEINETQLLGSNKVQIELMDSSEHELHHSRIGSNSEDTEPMQKNLDLDTEYNSSPINGSKQADEVLSKDTKGREMQKGEEDVKKSEETQLQDDLDDEELEELESLWEHQDLIEQLRMELRRVRANGLPTIFEESESPRTIADLKPWKIDEKFLREDPMDELHKFYKSYRERMRKFDILNYQKMYAIGFLQLKNPLESMGAHKPLLPTIISQLSQNLRPPFRRKSSINPSEKFMRELQVDLETVYVGQTCLSWEFLRWQYEKARELPDSDPFRSHQYNQVAGEFQQFQVILQRFIENETFQGPRLQNYVKNRCVLRNLLQVPVIKEDCLRDKMEEKRKGNYAVTSEMLEDIMEESIRIFWEFVKGDKDETSIILKGLMRNQVELQDPSDFELMSEIHASLQKKEKRLKDILKTGNCLVKKFKKPREDRSNQDLFFSQVDMKLVSRVLKMSKITTDQLVWCDKKLSKITFADRKIHREPSFLLFPC